MTDEMLVEMSRDGFVALLRAYAVPWRAHGWTDEADAIDEAADRLSSLEEEKRVLTRALREVDFNLNGLPEAMRLAMPHQAGTADALQQLLVTVRTALSAGVGR